MNDTTKRARRSQRTALGAIVITVLVLVGACNTGIFENGAEEPDPCKQLFDALEEGACRDRYAAFTCETDVDQVVAKCFLDNVEDVCFPSEIELNGYAECLNSESVSSGAGGGASGSGGVGDDCGGGRKQCLDGGCDCYVGTGGE